MEICCLVVSDTWSIQVSMSRYLPETASSAVPSNVVLIQSVGWMEVAVLQFLELL